MRKYLVTVPNPWNGTYCNSYFYTQAGAKRFAARHPNASVHDMRNFHMSEGAPLAAMIILTSGFILLVLSAVVWILW